MAPAGTRFRFHYVVNGVNTTVFRQKGHVTSQDLVLGDEAVSFDAVLDTVVRENHLLLQLRPDARLEGKAAKNLQEGSVLCLAVSGISARQLERIVDRECAVRDMARRKAELESRGEGHLLRSETCPACGAEVDLTEIDESRYVFCRYCDSVFTAEGVSSDGAHYSTCEACAMFGRIKGYPEFFFYFLLVVYGFRYRNVFLCDTCAGRLFWKALLTNLIFLVGVPTAIWVGVKSRIGRGARLGGLSEANRLARHGLYERASPLYEELRRTLSEHPGLLMNQALGCLQGGNEQLASRLFQRALEVCPNYLPAIRLVDALTRGPAA